MAAFSGARDCQAGAALDGSAITLKPLQNLIDRIVDQPARRTQRRCAHPARQPDGIQRRGTSQAGRELCDAGTQEPVLNLARLDSRGF